MLTSANLADGWGYGVADERPMQQEIVTRREAGHPPQVTSQVTVETFNQTWAAKDPAEFLGRYLGDFAVNFTIRLPADVRFRGERLREAIYTETEQRLFAGEVGPVVHSVIDYSDSKVPREPPRRYIRVQLNTARDSQVTTLFRCFVSGAHLYVAADSYRLGRINVTAVVIRATMSLLALLFTLTTTLLLGPLPWLGLLALLWFFWGDVLRASRQGGLSNGLRTVYPRPFAYSSFDIDDSFMFLKALLPMIIQVLKDVGPRHGMDLKSMEDLLEELGKKVATQTVNVTNNGSMAGVAIGGSGNSATSR